jgi:hypothetical protein
MARSQRPGDAEQPADCVPTHASITVHIVVGRFDIGTSLPVATNWYAGRKSNRQHAINAMGLVFEC